MAYLPILVCSVAVFIAYNIALIPIAYLKLFFHKMIMIMVYSKSFRVSRADKFMYFVLFSALGLFILTINAIVDIYYFIKHLLL